MFRESIHDSNKSSWDRMADLWWRRLIYADKLEKEEKITFDYEITMDGYGVSVMMHRPTFRMESSQDEESDQLHPKSKVQLCLRHQKGKWTTIMLSGGVVMTGQYLSNPSHPFKSTSVRPSVRKSYCIMYASCPFEGQVSRLFLAAATYRGFV